MRAIAINLWLVLLLMATYNIDKILTATQGSYVIKSQQIKGISEGLAYLRRFVPGKPTSLGASLQRCEKYAVLLHMFTSSVVDQFAIAELGLSSKETVRGKLKTIDVGTLRQLYIDGINSVLDSSNLDPAVIELVDCLEQKFKNIDAKARSFLNKKELQETIDQYKSILEMPIAFLLDPKVTHPLISSGDLKPSIRQALFRIFNGNITPFYTKFPLDYQRSPSYLSSSLYSREGSNLIQRDTTIDNQSKPSLLPQAEPEKMPEIPTEGAQIILTQDEQDYIKKFLAAIIKIHQSLAAESQLNDRCKAYGKVIQTDQDTLNDKLVDGAIGDILKQKQKAEKTDETDETFLPEKTLRDHFVFVVSAFGPPDLGDEVWIDLVYCVSQWQQEDPEVREFISSPKLIKEIEELMKNAEKAAYEAEKNIVWFGKPSPIRALMSR